MRLHTIVSVRIQRITTARFVFAYIFSHSPGGGQYGGLFDGYEKILSCQLMSKRTKALTLVFVFVLVLITALSLYLQNSDSINSVRIVMRNEDGVTESIALFKRADKYYAFLPSFADLHNISFESKSRYRC